MSDETIVTTTPIAEKAASSSGGHISLCVVSQDGTQVFFKIRRSTPLKKLMTAYCERKQLSPTSIRFLFEGQRVQDEQTPDTLAMEDNDVIDALAQQTGGSQSDFDTSA